MPTSNSQKNNSNNATFDNTHTKQITLIENEESKLPKLIDEKKKIKKKLLKKHSIENKLNLTDKLNNIKAEIKRIKSLRSKYYLENGETIFKYFENKKDISNNKNNKISLNNFFNIKSENDKNEEQCNSTKLNNQDITNYLINMDESFIDINNYVQPTDICRACNKGELIPVDFEGIMVCNNCGKHKIFLVENEKPSYKDPPKEACFYAYKRINHFREILAQAQAKESTNIPEEILDALRLKIKKERKDISELTTKYTKHLLKQLGYSKYYEHVPFIKEKLGIKPLVMSPELEETLCSLFMEIQAPYAKHCPYARVNFLNYYYTVYKLCELLGQTQFLSYFPMLKDEDKINEQDEIWQKICNELDWEFIPTIYEPTI